MEKSFEYINNHFPKSNIRENHIFDEVYFAKRYVTDEKLKFWFTFAGIIP